jgi:predicted FMN-binding regulatory protein PaiB
MSTRSAPEPAGLNTRTAYTPAPGATPIGASWRAATAATAVPCWQFRAVPVQGRAACASSRSSVQTPASKHPWLNARVRSAAGPQWPSREDPARVAAMQA